MKRGSHGETWGQTVRVKNCPWWSLIQDELPYLGKQMSSWLEPVNNTCAEGDGIWKAVSTWPWLWATENHRLRLAEAVRIYLIPHRNVGVVWAPRVGWLRSSKASSKGSPNSRSVIFWPHLSWPQVGWNWFSICQCMRPCNAICVFFKGSQDFWCTFMYHW